MKKLVFLVFLLSLSFAFSQHLVQPDTLWTRDLWQTGTIYQVQFLPDGRSVAVATGAGVSVLDVNNGDLIKRFNYSVPNNDNPCKSFAITEDGTKLITAHKDATIIVWDYLKVDTIKRFTDIALQKINFYNDNEIIGIWNLPSWNLDSSKVCIFDFNSGQIVRNQFLTNKDSFIDASAFSISKSGNIFSLVIGNKYNKTLNILICDLTTLKELYSLGAHNSSINDLSLSSDGKYLASASSDGIIKIWDVQGKKLDKDLNHLNMEDGYLHVEFTPNCGYLISSGGIGSMDTKFWDIKTNKLIYQYPLPIGATYSNIDIRDDSTLILLGRSARLYLLTSIWNNTSIFVPELSTYRVLFPNPSGNELNIPLEVEIIPLSIEISNANGQIVKSLKSLQPSTDSMRVDISVLSQGSYYVAVIYPTKTVTFKFEKGR